MLILVVEDEESIRQLIVEILTDRYQIIYASDGLTALELAQQNQLDLLITDYMMPRLNGLELIAALRADKATANLKIILLSAVTPVGFDNITTPYGVTFVKKPFDVFSLEALVEDILTNNNPPLSPSQSQILTETKTTNTPNSNLRLFSDHQSAANSKQGFTSATSEIKKDKQVAPTNTPILSPTTFRQGEEITTDERGQDKLA